MTPVLPWSQPVAMPIGADISVWACPPPGPPSPYLRVHDSLDPATDLIFSATTADAR